MNANCRALLGTRSGHVVVVAEYAGRDDNGNLLVLVDCDCGTIGVAVRRDGVRSGHRISCGCAKGRSRITHGATVGGGFTREYKAWVNMKLRCLNPGASGFASYGGRGIKVCERWLESFSDFLADMGPRPSPRHSLDRIDVNGNYEPGNCRWASQVEQCRNRRPRYHHLVTIGEETKPLAEWAAARDINYHTVLTRILNLGWSAERALNVPPRRYDSFRSLTGSIIREIRTRKSAGTSNENLAKTFNVTMLTIRKCVGMRIWPSLTRRCEVCGVEWTAKDTGEGRNRTCSIECRRSLHRTKALARWNSVPKSLVRA